MSDLRERRFPAAGPVIKLMALFGLTSFSVAAHEIAEMEISTRARRLQQIERSRRLGLVIESVELQSGLGLVAQADEQFSTNKRGMFQGESLLNSSHEKNVWRARAHETWQHSWRQVLQSRRAFQWQPLHVSARPEHRQSEHQYHSSTPPKMRARPNES